MADQPPPLDMSDEDEVMSADEQRSEVAPATSDPVEDTPPVEKQATEELAELDLNAKDTPPSLFESEQKRDHADSEPPTLETTAPDPAPLFETATPTTEPVKKSEPMDLFDDEEEEPKPKPKLEVAEPATEEKKVEQMKEEKEEKEEEEEVSIEEEDNFEMEITVTNPEKTGDGMGAYITYLVTTKTTLPSFSSPESIVRRRFSDFLGLHMTLSEEYMHLGWLVPPAPEKSVTGMTKVKFSKNEESGAAFVERRRASLERYLNRIAKHHVIRKDPVLKQFLENPSELPKAKQTAAMSGAGFMRLVKNVGDSISKIGGKKSDGDTWFEERESEYENLNNHLKKLGSALDNMISARKDLCSSTSGLVKGLATLGNVEDNDSVSRALCRLSEVQEKVEILHQEQANKDLFLFTETVKDYIALLGALKTCFNLRDKAYNTWQNADKTLMSKRETETKLQTLGKTEKIPQVQQEIKDWEEKEKQTKKAYKRCTKILQNEIEKFEKTRVTEFKEKLLQYLEALMEMQQELVRLWEGYLPDARAIA